jgi:hypothetical protein
MVNTSLARVLRRLVVEMKPPIANLNEYVSCPSKVSVENNFASKKFFVELDALINIRSKNMYVMNVTNQN